MTKPVFLWWAHKEMWDMLSKDFYMTKDRAMSILRFKYSEYNLNAYANCFACEASFNLLPKLCNTHHCPLDWSYNGVFIPYKCFGCCTIYSSDRLDAVIYNDGLFGNYLKSRRVYKEMNKAFRLARIIRDLPLSKHAYEFYTIEETPQVITA